MSIIVDPEHVIIDGHAVHAVLREMGPEQIALQHPQALPIEYVLNALGPPLNFTGLDGANGALEPLVRL